MRSYNVVVGLWNRSYRDGRPMGNHHYTFTKVDMQLHDALFYIVNKAQFHYYCGKKVYDKDRGAEACILRGDYIVYSTI